jgi:hypothetical protein
MHERNYHLLEQQAEHALQTIEHLFQHQLMVPARASSTRFTLAVGFSADLVLHSNALIHFSV